MVKSIYGVEEESKIILVYIEHAKGKIEKVSLEMLSKGRELADQIGWELKGLVVGNDVYTLASVVLENGADGVILANHCLLENFTVDAYSHTVFNILIDLKPSIFLLGATANGRDLAGRLAVRLRTGLNADCTDLNINLETGVLVCEVSGFGSGVLAMIEAPNHRPQMATVRPGVFSIQENRLDGSGEVYAYKVELNKDQIQTRIIEQIIDEEVELTSVPVLVAGGRGVSGNFEDLYRLAELLGGEVGATRPPVDDGYIERERQIGQTGVVCSPQLAICCGISGAFHFVVGIEKADIVISINSDPDAPIFEFSDYCVVSDVNSILPALEEVLLANKEVVYG
jgi:electron transfer flavoprotein alpha subunit